MPPASVMFFLKNTTLVVGVASTLAEENKYSPSMRKPPVIRYTPAPEYVKLPYWLFDEVGTAMS